MNAPKLRARANKLIAHAQDTSTCERSRESWRRDKVSTLLKEASEILKIPAQRHHTEEYSSTYY